MELKIMDAMTAIFTRRSIRKYTDQPVPEETIEQILKAAMYAPSSSNRQPWQFVVIRDRKMLDEIPKFHKYSQMILEAQVGIVVCGDMDLAKPDEVWVQDCSAATQNLLLAAHALGLGAVWLGVYPREERVNGLRKLLNLPDHVKPLSLISIGYPWEEKGDPERYDESRVHYDGW